MKITVLPYIDTAAMENAAKADSAQQAASKKEPASPSADFSVSLQAAERTLAAMTIDFVTSLDSEEKILKAADILSASNVTQLQEIGQALLGTSSSVGADDSDLFCSADAAGTTNTAASTDAAASTGTASSTDAVGGTDAYGSAAGGTDALPADVSPDCSTVSSRLGCPSELQLYFQEAAEKYNVDIALLESIAKTESNFRANAKSHAGAMGIMQLMPSTAQGLGVSDAYDAKENIMGGAKLIASLLNKYNNDVSLALAAYNAGSGNVKKYGGIPPFSETQNYVVKVLGYYKDAAI